MINNELRATVKFWKILLLTVTQTSIDIFFSILFLMMSYFMTVLGLIHVYIPGGIQKIKLRNGKIRELVNLPKIFGVSFILSSFLTVVMFYFFIFPHYR
ncbi:hypothetical protein B879_00002 [Cecembia lonarensis LW9]|uniref:Uncharacterized protein n=1 Tax=Cecembia lonarensis (strain CCUG 58316 / KCTC 22772 / LW9) TaxID=1225176 RepID=K1M4S6_CECL9|nr:hypothetical protein B879_00002 [Cecembia lonarensis LW9]